MLAKKKLMLIIWYNSMYDGCKVFQMKCIP